MGTFFSMLCLMFLSKGMTPNILVLQRLAILESGMLPFLYLFIMIPRSFTPYSFVSLDSFIASMTAGVSGVVMTTHASVAESAQSVSSPMLGAVSRRT